MFAVNRHWGPRQPRSRNCLDGAEVPRVDDVRTEFLDDADKAKQRKLQSRLPSSRRIGPRGYIHGARKSFVNATNRADPMLEFLIPEAIDHFENAMFSAAQSETGRRREESAGAWKWRSPALALPDLFERAEYAYRSSFRAVGHPERNRAYVQ